MLCQRKTSWVPKRDNKTYCIQSRQFITHRTSNNMNISIVLCWFLQPEVQQVIQRSQMHSTHTVALHHGWGTQAQHFYSEQSASLPLSEKDLVLFLRAASCINTEQGPRWKRSQIPATLTCWTQRGPGSMPPNTFMTLFCLHYWLVIYTSLNIFLVGCPCIYNIYLQLVIVNLQIILYHFLYSRRTLSQCFQFPSFLLPWLSYILL